MKTTNKPSIWFWIASALALIWNLFGVFNYLYQAFNQVAILETLNQQQRELFEAIPAWATAAFAIAVFSGTIACIALLLRKKWAKPLFVISLICAVAQFVNWLFIQKAPEVFPNSYTMPLAVVIVGGLLIYLSSQAINKGWLK